MTSSEVAMLGELYGSEAEQTPLTAMTKGLPLIVGGRLSTVDGRDGSPDVLIRWRAVICRRTSRTTGR